MFGENRPSTWIALGLSIVLHFAALTLAEILPQEPLATSSPSVRSSIRLIQLPRQFVERPSNASIQQAEINGKSALTSIAATTTQAFEREEIGGHSDSVTPTTQSIFFKPVHYYESGDLDNNSEPLTEWVLRTQNIQSISLVTIQLIIYINEDGKLDKFVVLNSSLSEAETNFVLMDFGLTTFKPATKGERQVPSQKRVELLLDPNPPALQIPRFLENLSPINR